MARAARKAKAKPSGRKAPASGKQRKYTRDNAGRFASTGTGATARGGRLLTAKGNKRKTQTITAAGQKGVLAKPKGLKPGSIKATAKPAAKSPKFTTEQSGRVRRAALGGGRTAIVRKNSAVIINAKGEPIMTRKGLPNITAGKKYAANPNARGPRLMGRDRSEASPSRGYIRTSKPTGTIGKPKGLKPGSIANSAAKRREANSIRKGNRVLTTDADRRSRKQSLATAERALAAVKASPGKGRDRLMGGDSKLKAAQARVDGLKGPLPNSRKVNRSAQVAANRDALAVKRSERRSAKTMADFTGSKPAAAKPAAKPAAKKARTDGAAFAERNKRAGKISLKRGIKESDVLNNGKETFSKRVAATQQRQSRADRTAIAAKEFYRNYGSASTFGRRPKLSTADGARFGAKKKAPRKPAVSARGRTAPKPAARTTPSSADGKLSFRSRSKAAAAQRAKTSQIQEKTSSQVIGAQRGVRRTAAAGHRSEKVAVTKVASKQGNLLTGKTETTKHVKARIVPRSGNAAPNSKSRRRSFGVTTRKMETPQSNLGRKKQRLRGIDAARAKKSPYDKKKAAKTLATRGKAMKYYDSINR